MFRAYLELRAEGGGDWNTLSWPKLTVGTQSGFKLSWSWHGFPKKVHKEKKISYQEKISFVDTWKYKYIIGYLSLHIYNTTQHHIYATCMYTLFYQQQTVKQTMLKEAWVCYGTYVTIQSTVDKHISNYLVYVLVLDHSLHWDKILVTDSLFVRCTLLFFYLTSTYIYRCCKLPLPYSWNPLL